MHYYYPNILSSNTENKSGKKIMLGVPQLKVYGFLSKSTGD